MPNPTIATIKRLFAVSGNKCAFPRCEVTLVHELGKVVGRVCHIRAQSPGGARFDSGQSDEQRHAFDNLLLLCAVHHDVVDAHPEHYTVERLLQIKADHEQRFKGGDEPSEELAGKIIETFGLGASLRPDALANWTTAVCQKVLRQAQDQLPIAIERITFTLTQHRNDLADEGDRTQEAWKEFRGSVARNTRSGRDKHGLGDVLGSLISVELSGDHKNRRIKLQRIDRALLDIKLHRDHALWNDTREMLDTLLADLRDDVT